MKKYKYFVFISLALALSVLFWGVDLGWTQSPQNNDPTLHFRGGRVTRDERKAAADRFKAIYNAARDEGSIGLQALDPGGIPHYFGPYGNWAYSPLPKGPITAITLVAGGTGYSATPTVTIEDVYGTGSGAGAGTATVVGGVITAITGGLGGTDYSAPIVTITDPTGTGAAATASIATIPIGGTLTGGIRKFIDKIPGLTPAGANSLATPGRPGGQYIPIAVSETVNISGQDADYYEIALVEFNERMHTDLPPTRHRGYVQLSTPAVPGLQIPLTYINGSPIYYPGTTTQVKAVDYPHFLGPVIVARGSAVGVPGVAGKPVPVRIKFYNLLPTGAGGDLFLPVDESVMGAGMGPVPPGVMGEKYTQNRAAVHLHGNNTVWISDGTPHQWVTPAGESTSYPEGVTVKHVPDMPDPGPGALTLFYTNAQSARLMFYHDHAFGITRLNVYAGEAAGYVLTDQVEQDMINGTNVSGVNPNNLSVLPGLGIPLVIQDRTFVDSTTIAAQDPTWNWGITPPVPNTGDLWYPHVYMSAQNPWDLTGTNAFGRWHYGPWFIVPTPVCDINGLPTGCIDVGPVPNPYCLPQPPATCTVNGLTNPSAYDCSAAPWEPPCMPGAPNPSTPGEAFMDTPIVNGTAYPYLEVEPKAYRFRILSAANDRFLNLQLYVAADKTTPTTPGTVGTMLCDGVSGALVGDCTEVKMVPVSVAPANQYADTPSGIPDPATKGPDWIQIGTEGGFLPKPVVVPQQPVGWNLNPTTFNFGVVNQHSLLLGSAERADVIVDFSAYAGKTLILYNDAPAAFPAGVPTYDYYTGVADQMDVGGAPTTQPGYGPNTRTIMQIRVNLPLTTPTTDVTLANLNAVFAKGATKRGVFEVSQDPIIIPQKVYESAYNVTNFPSTPASQYLQIPDTQKTFQPINAEGVLQPAVTMPLEMKAMHDEMGGVYDTQFGRMSGMLGLSLEGSPIHVLIPYGYLSPPVDIIKGSTYADQIGVLPDGTQIWRIFHNGVDTHTIHTHLFNSQLINRTDQSGIMLPPDPNELGWKDTFRINPLEVTWIAMRPILPTPSQLPFQVPNSIRLIDQTQPEGAVLIPPPPAGWFDPQGNQITQILNQYVNFGWEYVWHCHILAHEEMDMMHALSYAVPPLAPSNLTVVAGAGFMNLTWTDNSANETSWTVQRSSNGGATWANLATVASTTSSTFNAPGTPVTVTYTDTPVIPGTPYVYRVMASNTVGSYVPGFPQVTADSTWSNTASPPALAVALTATPPSPRTIGTTIIFNTITTGGLPPYQFKFYVRNPAGTWSVGQDYSAASSWAWNTTGLADGTYYFQVWVRNAGSTAAYDAVGYLTYKLTNPPVTSVSATPTPASPQPVGTSITWNATAVGGVSPQFKFYVRNPAGVWSVGQNYSAVSSWIWNTTGLVAGQYYIQVWARSAGSTAVYEAVTPLIPYLLTNPPVTSVSATPTPASPQPVGTSITWNATAVGGVSPQFKFYVRNPAGVWSVGQNYSAASSWIWNTTGLAAGQYYIQVWARSAGSTAAYEAVTPLIPYRLN